MSIYSGTIGSPELYLKVVWDKIVLIGPARRIIKPTSCLSTPGRRYSGKVSFLCIYVCPWDTYLISFSFTSARQTVSEQCWKQLQDTEGPEDVRAERKTLVLAQNTMLHVAYLMMMMMMMHLTAIFTFFFYTTNGWLCFFSLVTDSNKDIPPTAVHVRHPLRLQTLVSLCKICGEKWPSFATDALLCDQQAQQTRQTFCAENELFHLQTRTVHSYGIKTEFSPFACKNWL